MAYTIDVHLSPEEVRKQMRSDAVAGLQGEEKSIPAVWFYDERGSRLFEVITQLPEYYPTRAERALLEQNAAAIAELSKSDTLVELGAGACDEDARAADRPPGRRHAVEVRALRRERRIPAGTPPRRCRRSSTHWTSIW